RPPYPPGDRDRHDTEHGARHSQRADDSPVAQPACLLGSVHHTHAAPERPPRSRPCRSPLQLERKTTGPHPAATRALWQGEPITTRATKNIARNARPNGGDDAVPRELLHEQVQKAWLHRI